MARTGTTRTLTWSRRRTWHLPWTSPARRRIPPSKQRTAAGRLRGRSSSWSRSSRSRSSRISPPARTGTPPALRRVVQLRPLRTRSCCPTTRAGGRRRRGHGDAESTTTPGCTLPRTWRERRHRDGAAEAVVRVPSSPWGRRGGFVASLPPAPRRQGGEEEGRDRPRAPRGWAGIGMAGPAGCRPA